MDFYKSDILLIGKYFGVSDECASYLYHRSFRCKRKDNKYMPWDIKLQNAIVKADKCMGLNWNNIHFGQEYDEFANHGIIIEEMSDKVFKWINNDNSNDNSNANSNDNSNDNRNKWITVSRKKKKKKTDIMLIKRPGLFI
jgi:hypothetical protein